MIPTILARIEEPALTGLGYELHTSLEGENPGGSIKDHMALAGLRALQERGELKSGMRITEASAGSTARSLAYYARELGIPCTLFVPDTLESSRILELERLGAEVRAVRLPEGWDEFGEFARRPGVVAFNQLGDPGKRAHYLELGRRIESSIGAVEWVLGAVGTGHSLLGVAQAFRRRPGIATAEPRTGSVPGVRNIELTRHGPDDSCVPALFDRRVLLEQGELYPAERIETSVGAIEFPESFRLVLGALRSLGPPSAPGAKVFLVGAANRRAVIK